MRLWSPLRIYWPSFTAPVVDIPCLLSVFRFNIVINVAGIRLVHILHAIRVRHISLLLLHPPTPLVFVYDYRGSCFAFSRDIVSVFVILLVL